MRSFGMIPVLPAFAGHVPLALKTYFPSANISQLGSWSGFNGTYLLGILSLFFFSFFFSFCSPLFLFLFLYSNSWLLILSLSLLFLLFCLFVAAPNDPLFPKIGALFLEQQTAAYGTDHYYNTDLFNEEVPPSNDPGYLASTSTAVYSYMLEVLLLLLMPVIANCYY